MALFVPLFSRGTFSVEKLNILNNTSQLLPVTFLRRKRRRPGSFRIHVMWYSQLSHNAYGRAGRKVMQFRGYAGLELECIM